MADPDLIQLKARAEAMRRQGATMAEIGRVVGRAASTLHGWAAAGGWRLAEIEREGLENFCDAPAHPGRRSSLIPGEPETLRARGRACPFPDREGDGCQPETAIDRNLTPLEAAKALHRRSAELAAAGEVRAAEAAARLAERILRTEYHLTRIGGPPERTEEEKAREVAELRAELNRRFDRLRAAKAAQEAGNDGPASFPSP
jgi:hypothetical protein